MSYKKFIFDFESAVADTSACYKNAFAKAFSQFDIPFDESKIDEYLDTPLDKTFERYYRGCTCRFRDFVTLFVGCFDESFELCRPKPGSIETIRSLLKSGNKIGIVSRTYGYYVQKFLSGYGFTEREISISSGELTESIEEVIRKITSDQRSEEVQTVVIKDMSQISR